jgi:hypothetical protein
MQYVAIRRNTPSTITDIPDAKIIDNTSGDLFGIDTYDICTAVCIPETIGNNQKKINKDTIPVISSGIVVRDI